MQSNNVKNKGQLEQQPKSNDQQEDGQRQADDNDLEVFLYWIRTQTNLLERKNLKENREVTFAL
jgi:hypothetical protein